MHLLRPARANDLAALLELARYLDSPNLPMDEGFLRGRLERSSNAFHDLGPPAEEREYQFVLAEETDRVVGTCAILSKHGTESMPHLFLRVRHEERSAASVPITVQHRTLQLEACYDGPTELGALVLHPDSRGRPGWLGRLLSWGRFAFIAQHPQCFEAQVLCEMRAAMDDEGRSAFWRVFGKRFTGMSYPEADRRSVTDKKFILDLFPDTPFYASLLPADVESQLGQVHEEALPAVRLLERAGLRWIGEIDPFDAGPFYGAQTNDVVPIQQNLICTVGSEPPGHDAPPFILATGRGAEFRAVAAPAEITGGEAKLPKEACTRLEISVGDEIATTPLSSGAGG